MLKIFAASVFERLEWYGVRSLIHLYPHFSDLKGHLRGYQLEGLNFLIRLFDCGINGVLADEMVCNPKAACSFPATRGAVTAGRKPLLTNMRLSCCIDVALVQSLPGTRYLADQAPPPG